MLVLWLLVGLLVGTCVNFLSYRLPREMALTALPVRCRYCSVPLGPVDFVPLAGFLLSRGRCSACHTRLPVTVPLVELAAGASFGAMFQRFGFTWLAAVYSLYAAILILVFVVDLEHRLILDVVTYPAVILALVLGFITPGLNSFSGTLGGLFYGGLFLALYVVSVIIYKREGALGLGDVKLALFIGLIAGMPGAIGAALVGTVLGALAGAWLLLVRKASMKSAIPYGTALSAGALLILIWNPWIG